MHKHPCFFLLIRIVCPYWSGVLLGCAEPLRAKHERKRQPNKRKCGREQKCIINAHRIGGQMYPSAAFVGSRMLQNMRMGIHPGIEDGGEQSQRQRPENLS